MSIKTGKNGKVIYHCDKCGKKVSKKGDIQKTAKIIKSHSMPELDGKLYCRDCYNQLSKNS